MDIHTPSTPGEILAGWLEDLDMSVTAFAAHVGISRVMLSRILHNHTALTADTALMRTDRRKDEHFRHWC